MINAKCKKILNGIINIIIVVHRDPFFLDSYCCKSATTMQKVHHVGMIVPVGRRPESLPQER